MAFSTKYDQIKRDYEAERKAEKKIQRQSILDSIIVMVLLIAILFAFKIPPVSPPTPEANGGMEIILGNDLVGMNDTKEGVMTGSEQQQVSHTNPVQEQPQVQDPATDPNDPDAILKRQPESKTPVTKPVDPNNNKTTKPTTNPNPEPERQSNKNFEFHKSDKPGHNGTGGPGTTKGTGNHPGDQGDPHGKPKGGWDPNGTGGVPGPGEGFSLSGRNKLNIPKPDCSAAFEGVDVVQIIVNKQGFVTEVHGGYKKSTITNPTMIQCDEAAARKAKFSASETAGDRQVGYIFFDHTVE